MNTSRDLHADIGEILLTEEAIRLKVIELGARIRSAMNGSEPFSTETSVRLRPA